MRPEIANAIFALYPNVVNIVAENAYDAEGNQVEYDLEAVEAEEAAVIQAIIDTKQNALNKLMALGLTEAEALALGVK
jgi:hypothetical protein